MSEFEKLPSRIRYYLLDYKDSNMGEVNNTFGKTRLRDFTKDELKKLFNTAIDKDSKAFK